MAIESLELRSVANGFIVVVNEDYNVQEYVFTSLPQVMRFVKTKMASGKGKDESENS